LNLLLIIFECSRFWSTVVFNKQATLGLCTFLQEAAPPHMMDQLPQHDDVLMIYNEIDHFAFKLFKRLTTSSENKVLIFKVFLNNLFIILFYFTRKIICRLIICGACYVITIL